MGKLEHPNLVRLLGYSQAGEDSLLVYEYVPLRSLDFHLFSKGELRPKPRGPTVNGQQL